MKEKLLMALMNLAVLFARNDKGIESGDLT